MNLFPSLRTSPLQRKGAEMFLLTRTGDGERDFSKEML